MSGYTWHYLHTQRGEELVSFVNSHAPKLNGIRAILSNGRDYHAWVRHDGTRNKYELVSPAWDKDGTPKTMLDIIENRQGVPIGFNEKNPNLLHYLRKL